MVMEFFRNEPPDKYPFIVNRTSPKGVNRNCVIIGYAVNRNIAVVKNNIIRVSPKILL